MAWDQSQFDAALKRKYEIQGQQANADTTRANAAAQDVAQRPALQAAADAAAEERARLASQTQLAAEQARGGFGLQERTLANQGAANVANIQGGYGLREAETRGQYGVQEAQVRGQYGLEAAKQPEYGSVENPLFGQPGQKPYFLAPRNQSAVEALKPAVPGGVGPTGRGAANNASGSSGSATNTVGDGYGLNDPKRRTGATPGASGRW